MKILFWGLLIAALAGIIIFCLMNEQIKTAQLITENSIINTNPIEVDKRSVCVIISCFGILIGGRSYKFNREGIRLIKVDINTTEMTFCFGNEEKQNKIKVLHGLCDKSEVDKIAEKFRYETGVIPTVKGWE